MLWPSPVEGQPFREERQHGWHFSWEWREKWVDLEWEDFFPEYNYDWWEKAPFKEDVNLGHEKRNLTFNLDLKGQYDRAAELDQLLHYRKVIWISGILWPWGAHAMQQKIKRTGLAREFWQRKRKKLENKIHEKFSGNWRGWWLLE